VPAQVVERAKTGFGVPTGEWMRACEGYHHSTKGNDSRQWSRIVLNRSVVGARGASP
jgi:hypothetical protein